MKLKSIVLSALLTCVLTGTSMVQAAPVSADEQSSITSELKETGGAILPIGNSNDAYNKYFTGISYLSNLSDDKNQPVINVTFAHGAHTFWHIHNNSCQVLIAESGRGYYQIWGEEAHVLYPGDTVTIPAGVKHWHGAVPGTSFQHIAMLENKLGVTTDWLEPVDDKFFQSLK